MRVLVVLAALALAGCLGNPVTSSTLRSSGPTAAPPSSTRGDGPSDDAPLALKSIGFELDYYNATTNRAGDIEFTHANLFANQIFSDFGQQDPRNPTDPTKRNPQPTVWLPLHTKVRSLVDGVVINVQQLYSNDYTIMTARSNRSTFIYETEHVDNPQVHVGDVVKGGQVIAEVSSKDAANTGLGLLEIGILHPTPGGQPEHLCPYQYLEEPLKSDVSAKMRALYDAWETYRGDSSIYDQQHLAMPGCQNLEPVNG